IKELKTLQLEQKWDKQLLGEAYKDLGFVCCWPDGTPFDPDFIYHKFQDVLKEYNKTAEEKLPVYRIHDLRHTHGTILLEKNVDVKIVSRALRHSRASFTRDLYQHVLDDMLPESANIMDEVFNKEKSNEKATD
ncbi:MAG: tyrosine-type recombinase/integrase, partial [Acidaminococcaceae bacterium]